MPGALGDPPETTPRTGVPLVEAVVSYNLNVSVPVLSQYPPSENEIEYPAVFPMPRVYSYVLLFAYPAGEVGTGGGQAPSKSQFASQPLFATGVPDTPIVLLLPASYAASLCALPFAIPQVPLTTIL